MKKSHYLGDLVDDICKIWGDFFSSTHVLVRWSSVSNESQKRIANISMCISTFSGTCHWSRNSRWKAQVNIAIQDSWPNLKENFRRLWIIIQCREVKAPYQWFHMYLLLWVLEMLNLLVQQRANVPMILLFADQD